MNDMANEMNESLRQKYFIKLMKIVVPSDCKSSSTLLKFISEISEKIEAI